MSSLPNIYEVMQRIDRCKNPLNRMYMRAEYLFCARGIEIAGQLTSTDRKRHTEPYGPIGKDVFTTEIDPPNIPTNELAKLILTAISDQKKALEMVDKLTQKISVAVFKIKIAKQHLEPGEPYPYRLIALPLDKRFDPWAQEMYEYFHDAGDHYVFDLNRQDNWEYITRKDPIFAGFTYRIKKYHYLPNGQVIEHEDYSDLPTCLAHARIFKCHGIRHVRTDQLIKYLGFDGFDLTAFVGWSMSCGERVSSAPRQAHNYAEIREAWQRYIHKLCVPFNYSAFNGNKPITES